MNTLRIPALLWHTKVPATFDELTEKQTEEILQIVLSDMPYTVKRLQILVALFQPTKWKILLQIRLKLLGFHAIHDMADILVKGFFNPFQNGDWRIKKLGYKTLPEGLNYWNFGSFIYAENYYRIWHQNQDIQALNKLMAIIFNAENAPFDKIYVKARYFDQIPVTTKAAVAVNYAALRSSLVEKFPRLFDSPPTHEQNEKNERQSPDPFGWASVLDELSGTKFGNDRDTEQASLFKILFHLQRLIIKQNENKRE